MQFISSTNYHCSFFSSHSGDESENETTYIFNREVPASYLDSHEMSEAECDRDLHEFCEKSKTLFVGNINLLYITFLADISNGMADLFNPSTIA